MEPTRETCSLFQLLAEPAQRAAQLGETYISRDTKETVDRDAEEFHAGWPTFGNRASHAVFARIVRSESGDPGTTMITLSKETVDNDDESFGYEVGAW